MPAPEPSAYASPSLLLVIDPTARRTDGESVRIARDVLNAGAEVKVCLPETTEEYADAVRRAGRRPVVVVGDETALVRAVGVLYRGRLLGKGGGSSQGRRAGGRRGREQVVGWVPVSAGDGAGAALARALGVPADPVAAARAVLEGRPVARDLLVDDSDGVVLGALVLPVPGPRGRSGALRRLGVRATGGAVAGAMPRSETEVPRSGTGGTPPGEETEPERPDGGRGWWRRIPGLRAAPDQVPGATARAGLRVEADGELLADLATPLRSLTVTPSPARAPLGPVGATSAAPRTDTTGYAGVRLVPAAGAADPVLARARTVTVSGPDFHYLVDGSPAGPVRSRTWTVRRGIWSIVVT
ncbi:diacylglycerol kinase [Streptomyces sp. NPDC004959]|uniref:diacylglycerol kinase n=1 Tax=unclassified Streptomyces TaxID=2593676 RepID=UPI000A41B24D|nr:diacylglycerol kinase [Streptomyces sp. NRRL F-5630]